MWFVVELFRRPLLHLMISYFFFFFFNDTATTEIYTLSLHDALPISMGRAGTGPAERRQVQAERLANLTYDRSEEHTSELQSPDHLVCRLLLEKKKYKRWRTSYL